MRLDKYLADMGAGTRSEARALIRRGAVAVDGEVCRTADRHVFPAVSRITVNGRTLCYAEREYIMLNKPAGVISAREDRHSRTVLDCIRNGEGIRLRDIAPVGRLDKDTEGLLLLTNDGALAHGLLSPARHVEKEYFVRAKAVITPQMAEQWERGMEIPESEKGNDAFCTMPAVWRRQDEYSGCLTIYEGKYHQIKRMFLAAGNEVAYLQRIRMGSLRLDTALPSGGWRRLSEPEIAGLREDI